MICAFVIAGIILVILFSTTITALLANDFKLLIHNMQLFASGKYTLTEQEQMLSSRKDEIGMLHKGFNDMAVEINDLIEKNYVNELLKKEAQLKTLESQMDPHFLYNTLDSINWMAVKYGADDIEEMVTDLSQMLRYSLNNGVNQLKVSEELTQIRCYLNIQQKRFSNSFSTSYEIDPEVLDYQVIKLLLQPLVENALQHGFDESGQTGKLMLRVKKKENNIEFSVLNNGNKMDLEKVKQALQLPEDAKPTSYGLRNVNDRLVKYYGAESGLQFSIEGDYSCARFTIPAQL